MYRLSLGNWLLIRLFSARLTFLAAEKQPLSSMDRLMSTISTMDDSVNCSVR